MTENNHDGIKVVIQTFDELTTHDLYEILKVRSAVFVVEQNCPYQDLDGIDHYASHITLWHEGAIVAYARVFKDPDTDLWHIGRVLSTQRNKNYGLQVMKESIKWAETLGAHCIEIEAQSYAIGFYEKVGFQVCSDPFMLDGIPHQQMRLQLIAKY